MVVLIGSGDPHLDAGPLDERRLGQRDAPRPKVVGDVKGQQVAAGFETAAGEQRRCDPTVGTRGRGDQQTQALRYPLMQLDAHAAGRQARTDIQNMCRQVAHGFMLTMLYSGGKFIFSDFKPMALSTPDFIRALPKAELHVHIEGTLEPELVFALAAKHGIQLPYRSVAELRAAYRFDDLQSFLDIYYAGANVLRDVADFHAMTSAYLRRAHEDGIVHTEIFFDPQSHTARGIPMAVVMEGLTQALEEAQTQTGMTHRVILCFLRHLSAEDAMQTLEQALPWRDRLAGVGLDSSESGHPPSKFTAVFERARGLGLLTVAHAGEEGPPAYIEEALDLLKVRRIDHGVRCIEDPALMARLARERMPLTVCPLSNVRLRVFDKMSDHNLKTLLAQGLCVTVNSDDPAYFGGYMQDNFLAVAESLQLSDAQLAQLARNSIEASFIEPAAKQHWYTRIEQLAARQ
jgi:adenine deaminase